MHITSLNIQYCATRTNRHEVNFGIFQRRMQLTLPVFSILMNADHHVEKTTCHAIKITWKIPPWNCSNHVAVPRIPPRYHRDRYRTLKSHEISAISYTRSSTLAYDIYTLLYTCIRHLYSKTTTLYSHIKFTHKRYTHLHLRIKKVEPGHTVVSPTEYRNK